MGMGVLDVVGDVAGRFGSTIFLELESLVC